MADRFYSDDTDDIKVETLMIDGEELIVVTIYREKIEEWHLNDLDRAVIHIETVPNPKFNI